jgi:hypothetical protein
VNYKPTINSTDARTLASYYWTGDNTDRKLQLPFGRDHR